MKLPLILSLLLLLFALPVAPPASADPQTAPAEAKTLTPLDEFREELARLINQERVARGLTPLRLSCALTCLAQWHTEDMAARRFMDQTCPSGITFSQRMQRASGQRRGWIAENLAGAQPDAKGIFDAWMNSSRHRENMLRPQMNWIGIGGFLNPPKVRWSKGWLATLILAEHDPTLVPAARSQCDCLEGEGRKAWERY